jgi:hypothetical protein
MIIYWLSRLFYPTQQRKLEVIGNPDNIVLWDANPVKQAVKLTTPLRSVINLMIPVLRQPLRGLAP